MKIKKGEKPKIYISGKISGMEKTAAIMFKAYSCQVEALGYEVINPMALPHNHARTWDAFMREDIAALMGCHAVLFLPNYTESEGAMIEFNLAERLNFDLIFDVKDL